MTTEDQARTLLAQAAATVDVDATAPMALTGLPEPRPRRWPVVAAAAAVLVAVGSGWLVAQHLGDDSGTSGSVVATPTPGPTRAADEGTMPGLIGLTQEQATQVLEDRGLTVQVEKQREYCNVPGIVTGSTPPVGATLLDGGERVTIRVLAPRPTVDCVGELPWDAVWDLVRYARGADPAPDHVDVAGIPQDVIDQLAILVTQDWGGASPRLDARYAFDRGPCAVDEGWDLVISVSTPADGTFCPRVEVLARLDQGRIVDAEVEAAVDVYDPGALDSSMARLSSARRFVSWARGDGPAPAFADRVRVMYGGGPAFGSTGWTDDPADRNTYSGCSGLGFPDCGLDPVGILARYHGHVVPTPGRSVCADGGAVPQRFADAPEDVVRLEEPEPASCAHAWAVELWIDADGQIYGVNQAGSYT